MSSQLSLAESADLRLFQFVRKITKFFGSIFICQNVYVTEPDIKDPNEDTEPDSLSLLDSVMTLPKLSLTQSQNDQKLRMTKKTKIRFCKTDETDNTNGSVDFCANPYFLWPNKKTIKINNLADLKRKIERLLYKFDTEIETELANSPDEECVICVTAKATMQTYPCGHKVVCRKCFVKTIQMVVNERALPLRCVICRTKIIRLMLPSTPEIIRMYYYSSHYEASNDS